MTHRARPAGEFHFRVGYRDRNREIVRLYTEERKEMEDIGGLYNIGPEAVRNVLVRSGVKLRRKQRGPAKRQGQRSFEHGPPAPKGVYPLRLERALNKTFCGQCERLVSCAEADRCSSQFCKAKARAA